MPADKSSADKRLAAYKSKRQASPTPEPFSGDQFSRPGAFVVQKHAARSLHFDLRLELGGVLLSWAVPKGFSLETREKRLAVRTEDHPLDYVDFEGQIPEGRYGAGAMIVWDRGSWTALENPEVGLVKGKLLFELKGYKLKGIWTLVQTKRKPTEWLLIKKPDGWADPQDFEGFPEASVLSGLTVDDVAAAPEKAEQIRRTLQREGAPVLTEDPGGFQVMLAETAREPFTRPGWLFELKYDGFRMLALRDHDRVVLKYRSGRDVTRLYPELCRALFALPFDRFVVDGEVVVLDHQGKPSFQLLQRRRATASTQSLAFQNPATLFGFDLLTFGEFDLRSLPLRLRKGLLAKILPSLGPVRFADYLEEQGEEFYGQVARFGLEGIVAKRADSPYQGGRRSTDWLKIPADRQACFVVVGYTQSKSSAKGFGALHLAGFRNRELCYAGRVGTGFSLALQEELAARLEGLRTSGPQCQGHAPTGQEHVWTEPSIVVEVRFKETTSDGQLRLPVFLGIREEVPPSDCLLSGDADAVPSAAPVSRDVSFSNLSKVLWPEDGYTKGDLIHYYESVASWMLPYLEDRILVMDRYPDGIAGKSFFQKNAPGLLPDWMRTEQIWSSEESRGNDHIVIDSVEALLFVANLAAIPLHIWSSRVQNLNRPDWCTLDLDPTDAPFESVVEVAQAFHGICQDVDLDCFVKTSGSKGLHLMLPLGGAYDFSQVKLLAELLGRLLCLELPRLATVERRVEERRGRVYVDCLQNGYGKLIAAPFSVRPLKRAPVSTPLFWEEVRLGLNIPDFNILTTAERMKALGEDPLSKVLSGTCDLAEVLGLIQERIGVPGRERSRT